MTDALCVFPDTNVFLHFPPLKDIDWCAISGTKLVELIVCMTVVHELDAKKGDSRLSDRATRAIREIRDAQQLGAAIRDGVQLSVFNREVRAADFPDTLSPESADDRILHQAKLYAQEHPNVTIAVATGDYGMELRASAAGIRVISLGGSLRLPNPQDDLTKKYRQALAELNSIKNRLPKLSLGLSPRGEPIGAPHPVVFRVDGAWRPIDVAAAMARVRSEHPKLSAKMPATVKDVLSQLGAGSPLFVSEAAWEQYDADLDKFYDDYKEHFALLNLIREAVSRSFSFDLWLFNRGNRLATDIDVSLRFPQEVRFVAENGSKDAEFLEKSPEPPRPPQLPSSFEARFPGLHAVQTMRDLPELIPRLRRDEWTPEVRVRRDDNALNEIHSFVGKVKHGHQVCLGTFTAVFVDMQVARPFGAPYTITTADLGKSEDGELPFIVEIAGVE